MMFRGKEVAVRFKPSKEVLVWHTVPLLAQSMIHGVVLQMLTVSCGQMNEDGHVFGVQLEYI